MSQFLLKSEVVPSPRNARRELHENIDVRIWKHVSPSCRSEHRHLNDLMLDYHERPLAFAALSLHCYLGGPWEQLGRYAFRG